MSFKELKDYCRKKYHVSYNSCDIIDFTIDNIPKVFFKVMDLTGERFALLIRTEGQEITDAYIKSSPYEIIKLVDEYLKLTKERNNGKNGLV